MLIDGIHVPLTEPFYRDGGLYLRKLEHNVRRYSLSPVSGLVALPPTGEASSLDSGEAAEVLQAVGATAAREKVLVAGIEQDSVRGALWLARAADSAQFDTLLVAAPRSWRSLTLSALNLFFRAIADEAGLPLLLWSDGTKGGFEIPVTMIGELAAHNNIIGVYRSGLTSEETAAIVQATAAYRREVEVTTVFAPVTRRMKAEEPKGAATFVSAIALGGGAALATAAPPPSLKTRMKAVGFQIMGAGRVTGLIPLLQAGAAGAVPELAAAAPQGVYEAFAALKDGDSMLAIEKAARLEAADLLMQELGSAGLKYGCDLNGYFGGAPRLPRLPLTAEDRTRVEEALKELRN